jgi:hypothetical protein
MVDVTNSALVEDVLMAVMEAEGGEEGLKEEVEALLKRVQPSALSFLTAFLARAPQDDRTFKVQAGALRLLSQHVLTAGKGELATSTLAEAGPWLLVALSSPSRAVRAEALAASQVAVSQSSEKRAGSHGTRAMLQEFLKHKDAVALSNAAVAEVLTSCLAEDSTTGAALLAHLLEFAVSCAPVAGAVVLEAVRGHEAAVGAAMAAPLTALLQQGCTNSGHLTPAEVRLAVRAMGACTAPSVAVLLKNKTTAPAAAALLEAMVGALELMGGPLMASPMAAPLAGEYSLDVPQMLLNCSLNVP